MRWLILLLLCSPAWAAFRAAGTATTVAGGGSATVTPGSPSGLAANDIIICFVSQDASTVTYTWASGFTQLYNNVLTLDGETQAAAWKLAAGGDTLTLTRSSTSGPIVARCAAWSGRDTGNPPVGSTAATNNSANASPTTLTANAVTALTGDDLAWIGGLDVTAASATATFTQPAGYTSQGSSIDSASNLAIIALANFDNASAGSTGTVAGTLTHSGNSGWAAYLIRIPASGGATPSGSMLAGPSMVAGPSKVQ
jgi:hypothetical protein